MRAVKEEVGEAHGSWVEGGLLTHSYCPSYAKGGSPRCPADSQPPQPSNLGSVPAGWTGEAGIGLPQPPPRGLRSPLGPEGCSTFQSEPSRWQTPRPHRPKSSASKGAPSPQPTPGH